jgi:hypothetical protein
MTLLQPLLSVGASSDTTEHGTNQHTEEVGRSVRTSTKRGETSEYLTACIARDKPKILEEMKAGKYQSVRAAAKAAGLIKEVSQLDILDIIRNKLQ